jgi:hypothetical protein
MNSKKFVAVALAVGGALCAGVAQARDAVVQWSVTIGSPAGAPLIVPAPVRVHPVVHVRPYGHPTRWDRDGDGIPNRHDRVYNPRWDRDGDGIPNRYDRHPRVHDDRNHAGHRHDRHAWHEHRAARVGR